MHVNLRMSQYVDSLRKNECDCPVIQLPFLSSGHLRYVTRMQLSHGYIDTNVGSSATHLLNIGNISFFFLDLKYKNRSSWWLHKSIHVKKLHIYTNTQISVSKNWENMNKFYGLYQY